MNYRVLLSVLLVFVLSKGFAAALGALALWRGRKNPIVAGVIILLGGIVAESICQLFASGLRPAYASRPVMAFWLWWMAGQIILASSIWLFVVRISRIQKDS